MEGCSDGDKDSDGIANAGEEETSTTPIQWKTLRASYSARFTKNCCWTIRARAIKLVVTPCSNSFRIIITQLFIIVMYFGNVMDTKNCENLELKISGGFRGGGGGGRPLVWRTRVGRPGKNK